MTAARDVLWTPPPNVRSTTVIGRYMQWLGTRRGRRVTEYAELWDWSITDLDGFWMSVWDFFEVRGDPRPDRALASAVMPGAVWFPGVHLNYAEHALRRLGAAPAVVSHSQTRDPVTLGADELRDAVGRARAGLVRLGVGRGDRVVAYLPNVAETIVAFLATASLGAVWSSCPPEFGTRSVVDRFQQVGPTVLFAVDGYRYGDRAVDRRAEVTAIRAALPTLKATVLLPYLDAAASPADGAIGWAELMSVPGEPTSERVPFDHPLYILYSSGTTGLPKPIVHGHGGILLEHLKALGLHGDLREGDVFLWFSTTGWMMWNFLVSGLCLGAAVVCFDGNPGHPDLGALWRLVARTGTTYFGSSAPFLMACRKAGLRPRDIADLSRLRAVGSTGAPLPPEGFHWVYEAVGDDVLLSSVSGGTDVCTAFMGGCPLLPVRAGDIPCRYLGARVEAFDDAGHPVIGQQGELVVTAPMPSMPVGFWGDTDGSRYRAAYFDAYPGVWRHGDWVTIDADGACVISGRSDATLNRGGVRVGTAELYAVVEDLPEVVDSLVVHLEGGDDGVAGQLLLFVVTTPGTVLDETLRRRIATAVRTELSPRHVPDRIEAVPAVPRTLSGKKLEVPVKRVLGGAAPGDVASLDALTDPHSLDPFVDFARGGTPPL